MAGVEYDGSDYSGWQIQSHARSVQAEVEKALSRVADHPVATICAGRTDAGVHGIGQVVHYDSGATRDARAWLFGANSLLPECMSLRWVKPVDPDFSARHSALARRYRYLIHNSRSRSGLFSRRAYWFTEPLDASLMQDSAQFLVGEHDFSAFRAAECQARSTRRNVIEIAVNRRGDWISIDVEANAFLHHMVRNIVGVLVAVGQGKRPAEWSAEVLAARDRRLGGVTAEPQGLYFLLVRYDAKYGIPTPDAASLFP